MGVLALSACGSDLSARIGDTVKQGPGTKVVMSDLTDFDWQQLYVFAPYTTQKRIHRALGFEWSDPEGIELRDNISLLVFVSDGKVVKYVAQPRDRGDFADLDVGSPWTPATAAFVVAADGQATDGQPYLVMKPTS